MRKHQELNVNDLNDWAAEQEIMYASSSRERKRLVCSLKGGFKVMVAGKVVWEGVQAYGAVEAYNDITDKWVEDKPVFTL